MQRLRGKVHRVGWIAEMAGCRRVGPAAARGDSLLATFRSLGAAFQGTCGSSNGSADKIAAFTGDVSSRGSNRRRQRLTGPGRMGISIGGADDMVANGFWYVVGPRRGELRLLGDNVRRRRPSRKRIFHDGRWSRDLNFSLGQSKFRGR